MQHQNVLASNKLEVNYPYPLAYRKLVNLRGAWHSSAPACFCSCSLFAVSFVVFLLFTVAPVAVIVVGNFDRLGPSA